MLLKEVSQIYNYEVNIEEIFCNANALQKNIMEQANCRMPKLNEEDKILKKKIRERINQLVDVYFESQTDASKNLDIDRQNFNAWINAKSNRGPTIYSINRFCKTINISLEDFFDSPIFK